MLKLLRNKTELYELGPNGRLGKSGVLPAEQTALLQVLRALEAENEQVNYLEIGIFGGGTTHFLKENTEKTAFFGVDLFEDFVLDEKNTHVGDVFRREDVQEFLGEHVVLYKGTSEIVLPILPPMFDLIFIDGDHSYEATMRDFLNASKILRGTGFLAFHNTGAYKESDNWSDDRYIQEFDGGPWRVCEQLKADPFMRFVGKVERLQVFQRLNVDFHR